MEWGSIYQTSETQNALAEFRAKLISEYNRYFPKQPRGFKYVSNSPWLSDGLRRTIQAKNKLYIKK